MKRRAAHPETDAAAAPPAPVTPREIDTTGHSALAHRRAGPRSAEDAEAQYVAARDAWTTAMRVANSGRPADLASLAIAQEAYEAAAAERERWLSGGRVAIPVEPQASRSGLEAAIGQELAWRRVQHHRPDQGFLGRLKRRLRG